MGDAGGANHPISPDRLGPSCCSPWPWGCSPALGLGAAISPSPHTVSAGKRSGVRHPRPIRHRGRCVGSEAGAEWSMAAGKTPPPSRLALGKAAQMRIRAATFPRAAHMCQVKRGFGSTTLSRGTRTSGRILGSLLPRPALALRGSRRPMRLFPGRQEKSSRGCWGDWFFQRGCSSL